MRLRLGRPRVAMIVAPHPDDEVIGAAGLIASLRRRGSRVRVTVVSDGAASHAASRHWPRKRLVAERRRETRRALRRLGVGAASVTFLGLPDGCLEENEARCRRAISRELARSRLDLIVGPASGDAHPDHRAVASAIAARPIAAPRLAYRVWPHDWKRRGPVSSLRIAGGWIVKRSLIGTYRTQLGAISDDPAGFSIAPHELAAFAHPIEHYVELRR